MATNFTMTPELLDLIKRSGHETDRAQALEAQSFLAKALELPLRQGVLVGDIATNLFESLTLAPGAVAEFPLDLLSPGSEDEFVAFTNPGHGYIPQRQVEGDYVQVPTYSVANAIDWLLRYAQSARWDIIQRAMQVMEAGFVKKLNDDGWHTVITAGVDRNILVYDADATAGQFTKRLVSLMKVLMRRNGGGNTGSVRRRTLTDLYLSPEGVEDIRNWGVDQIDEVTRREIFVAADGNVASIFNVRLHDLDELGVSQEYQLFYTNQLGASLQASDVELVVGVDLSRNDSFLRPVRQELRIFEDPELHRHQKAGFYGWLDVGHVVLDNRNVILASY